MSLAGRRLYLENIRSRPSSKIAKWINRTGNLHRYHRQSPAPASQQLALVARSANPSVSMSSVASNAVTYTHDWRTKRHEYDNRRCGHRVHRYSANIQSRLLPKTLRPVSAVLVSVITIVNPPAPIVTAQTISGKVGTALSFTPQVTASNPVSYSMTGAPSGMVSPPPVSSAGQIRTR